MWRMGRDVFAHKKGPGLSQPTANLFFPHTRKKKIIKRGKGEGKNSKKGRAMDGCL